MIIYKRMSEKEALIPSEEEIIVVPPMTSTPKFFGYTNEVTMSMNSRRTKRQLERKKSMSKSRLFF